MIRNTNRTFAPPTDVIELPDKLFVLVELAGISVADLNITLSRQHLVISGVRARPQHDNPAYHQVEISFGSFRVELTLPWMVEPDQVTANYDGGFLQVELPRRAPKQITIVET